MDGPTLAMIEWPYVGIERQPMIIPKIEQNMVIEDALQVLSAAGDSTAIVTHDAKTVGSVDRDKIIAALARPNLGKGRIGTYR